MQIPDSVSEMTNSSLQMDGKDFLLVRMHHRARSFNSHTVDILDWMILFLEWGVCVGAGGLCHVL